MSLTRLNLEILANPQDLTRYEDMGKKSALSRGLPYYGRLKKEFPVHFSSFSDMHQRGNVDAEFERTVKGFINFILYIGPFPKNIQHLSVGRYDHSKG